MSDKLERVTSLCSVSSCISDLSGLFEKSDASCEELAASILAYLKGCTISAEDLKKISVFDEERYGRVLLAFKPRFTVVLCCFLPGQATPRHTHGRCNREAFVKTIQGALTLSKFSSSDAVSEDLQYDTDAVFRLDNNVGEHILHNEGSNPAISLHIYTPPYITCAFTSTEGKESSLPTVYAPTTYCGAMEELHRSLSSDSTAFTNLPCVVELLREAILPLKQGEIHTKDHISEVISLLSKIRINDDEWSQYSQFTTQKYTRNLIGYDQKFTALLLCWEKGQMSPIHDHAGSSCWVKVLKGNLREVRYKMPNIESTNEVENSSSARASCDSTSSSSQSLSLSITESTPLTVISDQTYNEEAVTYINDTQGLHMMGNASLDEVAVSLHIYSPPYKQCHVFDLYSSSSKVASITAANQPDCPFDTTILSEGEACLLPQDESAHLSLKSFAKSVKNAIDASNTQVLPLLLEKLVLHPKEWGEFVHFDEHRYTRSLIIDHEDFSLMLLGWNKGQSTPVHSHREGTLAFFKVLKGSLLLRIYNKSEEEIERSVLTEKSAASHCCVPAAGEPLMHKLGNSSLTETAVSLHLYTPAYIECNYQKKGETHRIPVVHCNQYMKEEKGDMSPSLCSVQHTLKTHTKIFTNLCSFVASIQHEKWTGRDMTRVLTCFEFNKNEWRRFLQTPAVDCKSSSPSKCEGAAMNLPQMCVVAVDEEFTVALARWISGVAVPVDYDGSRLWVKVLEGEAREESYGDADDGGLEVVRLGKLRFGDVAYHGPRIVHSITNEGKDPAVALMVFRGPLKAVFKHCIETKRRCLVKRYNE